MSVLRLRGDSCSSLRPPSADLRRYSDSGGSQYRRVPSIRGKVGLYYATMVKFVIKYFTAKAQTKKHFDFLYVIFNAFIVLNLSLNVIKFVRN